MPFSRYPLQRLLLHKWCWPITLSLPRHGRFLYLKETLKFSQHCVLHGHLKWEVNFWDFVNIPINGQNSFFQIRFFGFQMCLKAHLGQFWKHLKQRKIPTFSLILIKYGQYALFWLLTWGGPVGHTIDLTSEFLLGKQNRPCLGRKWVIGHQYLWLRSPCKVHLENGIFRETGCSTTSYCCKVSSKERKTT